MYEKNVGKSIGGKCQILAISQKWRKLNLTIKERMWTKNNPLSTFFIQTLISGNDTHLNTYKWFIVSSKKAALTESVKFNTVHHSWTEVCFVQMAYTP